MPPSAAAGASIMASIISSFLARLAGLALAAASFILFYQEFFSFSISSSLSLSSCSSDLRALAYDLVTQMK